MFARSIRLAGALSVLLYMRIANAAPNEMEPLTTAITRASNEKIAATMMANWTSADTQSFFWALHPDLRLAMQDGHDTKNQHIIRKHVPDLWAVVGNTFAAKMAREQLLEPGDLILTEAQFVAYNPGLVPPPDGLIYRIEGNQLIIKKVIEAKLGGAGYTRGQTEGLLNKLKSSSFLTPEAGPFSGDRVMLDTGTMRIRLRFVTTYMFERSLVLVRSKGAVRVQLPKREAPFTGSYLYLPLNESQTQDAVRGVAFELLRGKLRKDQTYTFKGKQIRDPVQKLRDWIFKHKTWPKPNKSDPWQKFLNGVWLDYGNQSQVFAYHLTDREREALKETDSLPAKHPLSRFLREKGPHATTLNAAHYYLERYCAGDVDTLVSDLGPNWESQKGALQELKTRDRRPPAVAPTKARWRLPSLRFWRPRPRGK